MANVSLARKKELMEPDEFEVFLKKIIENVITYKNQIIIISVILIALILSASGIFFKFKSNEKIASQTLSKIVNEYESLPKTATTSPELINKYQHLIDEYSGTSTAKFARVRLANICYGIGNYDKAIVLYKKGLKDFKDNKAIKNMVLSGLGYAYFQQKDYESAKEYFEQAENSDVEIVKEEALFNLGLLYSITGNASKSIDYYNKLLPQNNSLYSDLIKEKLVE